MSDIVYETQAQREDRLERENRQGEFVKKRSRNQARNKGVRREVMARANMACEICLFDFWAILNVHHIKPVQFGGTAIQQNLIVLCRNCHGLVHHFSHFRKSDCYERWTRGLMETGLTEDQAKRLLLVASGEAVVHDDGVIESYQNPKQLRQYVLVDESHDVEDN